MMYNHYHNQNREQFCHLKSFLQAPSAPVLTPNHWCWVGTHFKGAFSIRLTEYRLGAPVVHFAGVFSFLEWPEMFYSGSLLQFPFEKKSGFSPIWISTPLSSDNSIWNKVASCSTAALGLVFYVTEKEFLNYYFVQS